MKRSRLLLPLWWLVGALGGIAGTMLLRTRLQNADRSDVPQAAPPAPLALPLREPRFVVERLVPEGGPPPMAPDEVVGAGPFDEEDLSEDERRPALSDAEIAPVPVESFEVPPSPVPSPPSPPSPVLPPEPDASNSRPGRYPETGSPGRPVSVSPGATTSPGKSSLLPIVVLIGVALVTIAILLVALAPRALAVSL